MLNDRLIQINPDEEGLKRIETDFGKGAKLIMGFWGTKRQFGWIAFRLLADVTQRLGLPHLTTGLELTIDCHMPPLDYFDEDCKGQPSESFVWNPASHEAAKARPFPPLPDKKKGKSSDEEE